MADWTRTSLVGCYDIISSFCLHCPPLHIGTVLGDAPPVMGPLCVPKGIGNRKPLLAQQCCHSDLRVLGMVQTLFSFSCSAAPHEDGRRQASEDKLDSKIVGNEAVVVVHVDNGPLKSRCVSSGEQVHPRVFFIWQDNGVGIVTWHWGCSRTGEQPRPTFPCKQVVWTEAHLHRSFQPHHELLHSCCRNHVP